MAATIRPCTHKQRIKASIEVYRRIKPHSTRTPQSVQHGDQADCSAHCPEPHGQRRCRW